MKIRPVGVELFHADGQEDVDSHFFSKIYERAYWKCRTFAGP